MLTAVVQPIIKIALIILLLPALACAVEFYVDGNNGDDENDGSETSPWKTIQRALLSPGIWLDLDSNTLYLLPARYNEAISLYPVPLRSLNIIGIARDGDVAVIDGSGVTVGHTISIIDYSGTIQGLKITGAFQNGIDIAGNGRAEVRDCRIYGNVKGIHARNSSAPYLSNNEIYDNRECGVATMDDSTAIINGNRIYQNGNGDTSGTSAGICVAKNSAPEIYNNIIRNNYPAGISVVDAAKPVVSNNVIAYHRYANFSGAGIKVIHNIGITAVLMSNNIIYDNDYGLFSQGGEVVTGNSFNAFWQNSENIFGFTRGSQDIFTDPLLNANYSVSKGSPCIDSGTASNAPAEDIDGVPRPKGAGFDRGIYESLENGGGAVSAVTLLLLSK